MQSREQKRAEFSAPAAKKGLAPEGFGEEAPAADETTDAALVVALN